MPLRLRRRRRLSGWLATRRPRGHIPRDAALPGIDARAFFESRQTARNDGARGHERCKVLTYELQCEARLLCDLEIEPLAVSPQAVEYCPSFRVATLLVVACASFRITTQSRHFVFTREVERDPCNAPKSDGSLRSTFN